MLPGPATGHLSLIRFRGGKEVQLHPAHGNAVPGLHRCALQLALTVEQDTAAVVYRVHRPLALVISAQSGMTPGHRRKVHPHIGAAHPADHVFPVGQVVPGAVGEADKAPDLRLLPLAEQGQAAAQQHPHRCQKQQHPARPKRRRQGGAHI